MPKAAIIIPNYNGVEFIEETIINFQRYFLDYEIVVIDDFSTDTSVELLSALDITLLIRNKNGGFAAAINTGLKYLFFKEYKYTIISNSDIMLNQGISKKIISYIDKIPSNDNVGVIGFREEGDSSIERQNEKISGFFFCLNSKLVQDINYFDESYFMYGEEQDYFRRTLNNGYKIVQSNIFISHEGEKSGKGRLKNSWLAIRNAIKLEIKFYSFRNLFKNLVVMFLIINRIYKPPQDCSVLRLLRPGIFLGNLMLFYAVAWNLCMLPITLQK